MSHTVTCAQDEPRQRVPLPDQLRLGLVGHLILFCSLGLTGCSDPKEASANNFAKAINDHLGRHGEICLDELKWPVKVPISNTKQLWENFPQSDGNRMAALEAAGLVTSTLDETKDIFNQPVRTRYFNLSDTGRQYLVERNIPNFLGEGFTKRTDLCWGRMRLAEVRKWVGPGQFGPSQLVSVKYTYQIDGIPDWARTPAIGKAFATIPEHLNGQGSVERNANLHLTNLGWEMTR